MPKRKPTGKKPPKKIPRSGLERVESVRLYPTKNSVKHLKHVIWLCAKLYNAALEERKGAYKEWKRLEKPKNYPWPTYAKQYDQLIELRDKWKWIKGLYGESGQEVLRRLDKAFNNFFARAKAGLPGGYPRFKGFHRFSSFVFPHGDRAIKVDHAHRKIFIPMVGWVKYRNNRGIPENFGQVHIVRKADGWYANFEHVINPPSENPTVFERKIDLKQNKPTRALDVGITHYVASSDRKIVENPRFLNRSLERLKELHRVCSFKRPKPGKRASKSYRKACRNLSLLYLKISRQRLDFQHKLARMFVDRYGFIGVEDLQLTNMTASAKGTIENPGTHVAQKSGLNRSILDAAWGRFVLLLICKAEEAGSKVIKVPPHYSSQECSACGYTCADNRISRAWFICGKCRFESHADVNAALVLQKRTIHALKCLGLWPTRSQLQPVG
jgi:putative transposase